MQMAEWEEKWSQIHAREQERSEKDNQKRLASERTAAAQQELQMLGNILQHTLEVNDAIDWDKLKDLSPFPEPKPGKPQPPAKPEPQNLPYEPHYTDLKYQPQLGFLDSLISKRRERITNAC
ncbi:MAG TPA: restriction endonuclease, partial [Armatimonadota bacterium]|nr:restriction endonuclease [Armatimonadota bacterium]